jgi:hypothetical protein
LSIEDEFAPVTPVDEDDGLSIPLRSLVLDVAAPEAEAEAWEVWEEWEAANPGSAMKRQPPAKRAAEAIVMKILRMICSLSWAAAQNTAKRSAQPNKTSRFVGRANNCVV